MLTIKKLKIEVLVELGYTIIECEVSVDDPDISDDVYSRYVMRQNILARLEEKIEYVDPTIDFDLKEYCKSLGLKYFDYRNSKGSR
jgi:hypothetical protein